MENNPREKLPNRRRGYTREIIIGETTLFIRTGDYPDGRLGEIFVNLDKEGSLISSLLNSFCIVTSIALQSGTPLDTLVDKFIYSKFEPAGIVRNHPDIKFATSILDVIFRDLAIKYLDRQDLKHK